MPPYDPGTPGPHSHGVQQDHPSATTALVLGILGLVLCQVLSPFAWVIGGRAVREIDASQGTLGGRGSANAGRVLGIVGTALLVVGLVVGAILLAGLAVSSSTTEFESTCTQLDADGTATSC